MRPDNSRNLGVLPRLVCLIAAAYFCGLGVRATHLRLRTDAVHAHLGDERLLRVASTKPPIREMSLRPLQLYTDVYKRLEAVYVDPLPSDTELALGSLQAMVNSLGDPNSRILSRREAEALQAALRGEFSGLGAVLTVQRVTGSAPVISEEATGGMKTITVVSVIPGSPAENAGLAPGDKITEIDGRWIAPFHFSSRELIQVLDPVGPQDGPPGGEGEEAPPGRTPPSREQMDRDQAGRQLLKSAAELRLVLRTLTADGKGEHDLTVIQGKAAPKKVHVTLQPHRVEPVSGSRFKDDVGMLRIHVLGPGTAAAAREVLAGFRNGGLRRLVVDLRNCPGGDLDAAAEVAGLLVGSGQFGILRREERSGKPVDQVLSTPKAEVIPFDGLAVVVNKGTAGAAEMLAACLRDRGSARLFGAPTFGDGGHQKLFLLEDGSAILLSTARMLTSRGFSYNGRGLVVDHPVGAEAVEAAGNALRGPKGDRQ